MNYVDFDLHISPDGYATAQSIHGSASAQINPNPPSNVPLCARLVLCTHRNITLSRYLHVALPPGVVRSRADQPLNMLLILASPNDQSHLDVEAWEQLFRDSLAEPINTGLLTLTVIHGDRISIRDAFLYNQFHIVQFVCHGVSDGKNSYLALVNRSGGTWGVDASALRTMFSGYYEDIGLNRE